MSEEFTIAIVAGLAAVIGSVVGAVIAGLVSSNQERENRTISAELEIAKFRESWINNLRDTLSEFQSYAMLPNSKPHLEQKFYELGTKIELLSNRDEEPFKRLNKIMYKMLDASEGDINVKYSTNAEFVKVCQDILKIEWDRIKTDLRFHYT